MRSFRAKVVSSVTPEQAGQFMPQRDLSRRQAFLATMAVDRWARRVPESKQAPVIAVRVPGCAGLVAVETATDRMDVCLEDLGMPGAKPRLETEQRKIAHIYEGWPIGPAATPIDYFIEYEP